MNLPVSMIDIQSTYIATGGNRHPLAADWDLRSGLLAFGSDQNVALWHPLDPINHGVSGVLRGHTDIVNAVKFLALKQELPSFVLSGSADQTIRVWRLSQSSAPPDAIAVLKGHSSSVNCLAVAPDSSVAASGAADGTVRIWRFSFLQGALTVENVQTISLSPKLFPLTLALHTLREDDPEALILAVAGTKNIVQVYATKDNQELSFQASLTGHEGWIRSLAFCRDETTPSNDLLLASASQDKYIRLWRISLCKNATLPTQEDVTNVFEPSLSNKAHIVECAGRTFNIDFEALLLGHDDWIYSVSWCSRQGRLQLLSASEDNSLAIWEREEPSGVWIPTTRLGEISVLKGSTTATGSAGGFWIGLWSPTGEQLVSLGRTGSWRLWDHDSTQQRWLKGIGISGHTKSVMDIAWSRDGSYLLSTGSDQTTRLHAKWTRGSRCSWHEVGRPQIHGYDLNCIDSVKASQFISGADEKLLRVFDEPRVTADLLAALSGVKQDIHDALPETADIPVLGLSNKAIDAKVSEKPVDGDVGALQDTTAGAIKSLPAGTENLKLAEPPTEDQLARHTLWPEREKLYGHGHEISAVAVSPTGDVVATACKASSQDHAVIRLYSTGDWREIKSPLQAHSLTVTSLRFSKNGQYLLSVGRDRLWALWELTNRTLEGGGKAPTTDSLYTLKCTDPKGHSRMILNADWAPTAIAEGKVFATAGRDKASKVWSITASGTVDCVATIAATAAVTSIAIAPRPVGACMMMATGTETGNVSLHILNPSDWSHVHTQELEYFLQPSRSVTQLAWQPGDSKTEKAVEPGRSDQASFCLAVASEDSSVRLFNVDFKG